MRWQVTVSSIFEVHRSTDDDQIQYLLRVIDMLQMCWLHAPHFERRVGVKRAVSGNLDFLSYRHNNGRFVKKIRRDMPCRTV